MEDDPKDFTAEYAKSGRSKCQTATCKATIEQVW